MAQTNSRQFTTVTSGRVKVKWQIRNRFYFLIAELKRNDVKVTYVEDKGLFESNFYNFRMTGRKEQTDAFMKAVAGLRPQYF